MSNRSITVIWNSSAGSAEHYGFLRDELKARQDVTLLLPQSGDEARQMARDAANGGADVVVAAGGDGTINDIARGILEADGDARMGAIPLGTGNDLCRNLAIPLDPAEAFRLLEAGEARQIDVIRVDAGESSESSLQYVNMATGGNTGSYTDLITDEMKQFWGPLVYVRGVVDILTNLQVYRTTVRFDDEPPLEVDALNLFVANGRGSGGGLPVAPDAMLDDGLLDVVIVRDCTPLEIAELATHYALSDYRNNENIIYRRAESVTLSSRPPLLFSTDGDVIDDLQPDEPICFTVQPQALGVVVGESFRIQAVSNVRT